MVQINIGSACARNMRAALAGRTVRAVLTVPPTLRVKPHAADDSDE